MQLKNHNFAIINNDYPESAKEKVGIATHLKNQGWKLNADNPALVIILGGDGTVLEAIHKYNDQLDEIIFFAIRHGHLGFYACKLDNCFDKFFALLKANDDLPVIYYDALAVKADGNDYYALNEIKLVNEVQTLRCSVAINDWDFETIWGSGLVVSTKTGTSGYIKSVGGALIASNYSLMELQEIAPVFNVANNDPIKFALNKGTNTHHHSLNAPLILDDKHQLSLYLCKASTATLVVDTFPITWKKGYFKINLVPAKIKFLQLNKSLNYLTRLQRTFIK